MSSLSISFVKGKGSIRHNNRSFIAENIDPNRTKNNIVFKQENLYAAYEHCFKNSIEEYNKKQKRSDRKIDGVSGYISKIKTSKNGEKLFYENVIQIGNKENCYVGSANSEKAISILSDYVSKFQKNNPNLYIFNAVLHLDEATPHLHIDYIPVATGYKTGLSSRNSLDKALKQQGIGGKSNKFENSTVCWQEKEKNTISDIMLEYGIYPIKKNDLKVPHLSVNAYKFKLNELNKELESTPEIKYENILMSNDFVKVKKADLENIKYVKSKCNSFLKSLKKVENQQLLEQKNLLKLNSEVEKKLSNLNKIKENHNQEILRYERKLKILNDKLENTEFVNKRQSKQIDNLSSILLFLQNHTKGVIKKITEKALDLYSSKNKNFENTELDISIRSKLSLNDKKKLELLKNNKIEKDIYVKFKGTDIIR